MKGSVEVWTGGEVSGIRPGRRRVEVVSCGPKWVKVRVLHRKNLVRVKRSVFDGICVRGRAD